MSINQIISCVPQSAFQQMNKFINILSSVDKKIYFFATVITGLSVLLASREIKSRKLENRITELSNEQIKLNNVVELNKNVNFKLKCANGTLISRNRSLIECLTKNRKQNTELKLANKTLSLRNTALEVQVTKLSHTSENLSQMNSQIKILQGNQELQQQLVESVALRQQLSDLEKEVKELSKVTVGEQVKTIWEGVSEQTKGKAADVTLYAMEATYYTAEKRVRAFNAVRNYCSRAINTAKPYLSEISAELRNGKIQTAFF